MSPSIRPVIGHGYQSHGEAFRVVAIDEDAHSVGIEYADGELAEMDLDDWLLRAQAGALRPVDDSPREGGGGLSASSAEHDVAFAACAVWRHATRQ